MKHRDPWTYGGIAVVAVVAAVMSFVAWSLLGQLVGITQAVHVGRQPIRLAWLLPIAVDVYGLVAARVWLRTGSSQRTRDFARRSSLAAIGTTIGGNALYHLVVVVDATTWAAWWVVVVLVSAIPAVQLGFAIHLAALVDDDRSAPAPPVQVEPSTSGAAALSPAVAPDTAPEPVATPVPSAGPAPAPEHPTPAAERVVRRAPRPAPTARLSDDEAIAAIRQVHKTGVPGQNEIRRITGCGVGRADKLAARLAAEAPRIHAVP